jgi:LPXTG-motif cell wall-anchored protein
MMVHLGRFCKNWGWVIFLPLAAPALAHNVKVSGEVAATFHIEPHHNPKAGKPSQAWFALTERGGKVIPLAQCSCKLAVHLNPHKEGEAPLLEPALKALSTEQYQGIPSAEITFPKVGAYELEISGTPKAGAKFQPFELSYEVTVASGAAASEPKTQPSAQPGDTKAAVLPKTEEAWPKIMGAGLGAAAIATLGYVLWRRKIQ